MTLLGRKRRSGGTAIVKPNAPREGEETVSIRRSTVSGDDTRKVRSSETTAKDGKLDPPTSSDTNRKQRLRNELLSGDYMHNPDNRKPTCRFDFAKDLCKDYNESGYCVFGDTCIFLHDRGDYKSGWELDLEWEERQKNPGTEPKVQVEENTATECAGCSSTEFNSPVVAECGHKYCEQCALREFAANKRCVKCGQKWKGSFRVVQQRSVGA